MGRASLNNQFFNVFQQCTEFGRDKHSDKASGDNANNTIIYSRADREALADTSKQLVSYIKENYDGVKMIRDITPSMVQNFLDSKVETSQFNIDKLWSHVGKIERMAEKVFNVELGWKENLEKPDSNTVDKIRDIAFSPQHWNMVKEYLNSKSFLTDTEKGILLGRDFGLRAESITNIRVKDITFNVDGSAKLFIYKDKGGMDRTLHTDDPEVIARLKSFIEGKKENDKIIPVKPDSINRQLARIEQKLSIREEYQEAKTGMHSIRKMWGRERFIMYMEQGMSKQGAMDAVSKELGHGEKRNELMKVYIGADVLSQY